MENGKDRFKVGDIVWVDASIPYGYIGPAEIVRTIQKNITNMVELMLPFEVERDVWFYGQPTQSPTTSQIFVNISNIKGI